MFQLAGDEKLKLVTICDRFVRLKHSTSPPFAFTEQGVAMLSSILNSERAIEVNIAIMRVFVRLRRLMVSHRTLASKLRELEDRIHDHDEKIVAVFEALRQLMAPPDRPRKKIGFLAKEPRAKYGRK